MPSSPTESPGAPAPAVEAAGVCRRYGRRWALVDVDLAVPQGSSLLVAGRNGSGKSTLLRVLSTLLRPDRGTDPAPRPRSGAGPAGCPPASRASLALLEPLRGPDRAREPRGRGALPRRPSDRVALLPALAEVGLADRADDPVVDLLGRDAQAPLPGPHPAPGAEVVFLDEPYGQLDPPGFRLVDRVLGALRARGATVLIATHLLERGAALCDLGLVLEGGRVAWSGPAAELPRLRGLDRGGLSEGGE